MVLQTWRFKVIINCYNKRSSSPSSIFLLMEDIWKLSQDLNIYNYGYIFREENRTTDCLTKKVSIILILIFGAQIFLRML